MDELQALLRDKHNEIWINGRFLALRTFAHSCCFLYSVDDNLVELIYDKNQGKIISVSFADHDDLNKYLDDIGLAELIKD